MLQSRISVALVVAKQVVAQALRAMLESDAGLDVIADVNRPCELAAVPGASVVVVDSDRPDLTIEELVAGCARATPLSRVCVLSSQRGSETMQRALTARADAYVVRDLTPAPLAAIIRSVAGGEYYADPRIAGALLRRRSSRPLPGELSNRESDIIRLITAGLSNRDIGARLLLSEKTVKNHISKIFVKLKVRTRSQVATYAFRKGLLG